MSRTPPAARLGQGAVASLHGSAYAQSLLDAGAGCVDDQVMETLHFRIFFWQKMVPLLFLPIPVLLVAISPIGQSWGRMQWTAVLSPLGLAVIGYVALAWLRADVRLDGSGMTLCLPGGWQRWPYEKLLKVRQIGRYRVRMCFDPDLSEQPELHMHITADFIDSDGFVDALLDRYAETQGHELPAADEHSEAAA